MTKPELIEKLSLFYYFSLLDEAKAQFATLKTLKKIKLDLISKRKAESDLTPADFVHVTDKSYKNLVARAKPVNGVFSRSYVTIPENSNWGPWFELRKALGERDFKVILYAKILKISEVDIAFAMNVSLGTIHYRLGRALRKLGEICQKGGAQNA